MFLIWSEGVYLSGALIFSYLELLIWSFEFFFSGTLNFSYLRLRILLSGALILLSSGVLIFSYLEHWISLIWS